MLNEMWLVCTNCAADNHNPPLSPVLSIIALYNNILQSSSSYTCNCEQRNTTITGQNLKQPLAYLSFNLFTKHKIPTVQSFNKLNYLNKEADAEITHNFQTKIRLVHCCLHIPPRGAKEKKSHAGELCDEAFVCFNMFNKTQIVYRIYLLHILHINFLKAQK